jgi:hypothetical protein
MTARDVDKTPEGSTEHNLPVVVGDFFLREAATPLGHGTRSVNDEDRHPIEYVPSNTASLVAPPPDGGFWAWMSGKS